MNNSIIESQRKAYGETFSKHGATPLGTFQNNSETQYLRFDQLIKNIKDNMNNSTVHDIGPGTCEFHKYLLDLSIPHQYSGTEIVQDMIDYSMNLYPEINLFNRDFRTVTNEKYDFVFLSGTLNLKLDNDTSYWKEFSLNMIKTMFETSSKAISFNFLTTYNTFSDVSLMYFNPLEILDFCLTNLSRYVTIDHCYPLYECTVTVEHEEFIKEKYSNQVFNKYFKNKL